MKVPPLPPNEPQRLKALQAYGIMDTPPEPEFDDITALAAEICGTPIALISLIDETRQWFKSKIGLATPETSREEAFCAHALVGNELLLVPDAELDQRFAKNPSVTGDPGIRFYAGAPLVTPGGETLGTLCVIDRTPRQLTDRQQHALRVLGRHVMMQLELRRHTRELAGRERLLQAVFDSEPECVKLLGPDGSLRMMNRAGLAMIEADTFAQVAGLGVNSLIAADHRAAFKALTGRVFRGDSGRLEFQITGLKGGTRWLETHAVPLRDESGEVTALLGITRDITERKQTEEALAIKSTILAAVTESLASYVDRGDWQEALGRLLRCALGETRSEYGFIGVVVGDTSLRVLAHEGIVWDKILNREFYEQALRCYAERGYLEFTNFDNLFGRAITTGGVVMTNLPARDARSGGLPPGHPPMHSFLGVPIFAGPQVTGVVALANRPGGYSEEDQCRIETLVQHAGGLCTSYRLHQAALDLEQERRKTEQAMRVSDERFQWLSKATNDAIWDWDFATERRWWNEGYAKLFGHLREQADSTLSSWTDYIHPEDLPRVTEGVHQVIEHGGAAWTDEYRFRCADGSYRHVLDRGYIIRDAAGKPVRMIGGMTDQTESKQAEERVRQQARRLAAIVEAQRKLAVTDAGIEQLMESIAEMAQQLIGAEGGVFEALVGDELHYRAVSGLAAGSLGLRLGCKGSLSGEALRLDLTLRCDDTMTDPRVDAAACRQVGIRSMVVTVLRSEQGPLGIIKVLASQPGRFTEADASALELLAESFGAVLERRRSAGRLRASEEQYRLLFADNPQPMWVFDFESLRFMAVNAAAVRHYGYTEAEFLAMSILDIRPPEAAAKLQRTLQQLPAEGKRSEHNQHRKKDGTCIEVDITSDYIRFAGRPARLVLANDVTERHRAEEKLREQAALLDKAQDAILVRDLEHRITYWNKSAERLYGWPATEALGRSVRDLLYFDPGIYDRAMAQLLAKGEWSGEFTHLRKDGEKLAIEGRWTLVRDDKGRPRSVLAINTDITERKKLEQQFLRAQRMESIGTLAGGIAHDLNNLLAPITMGVGLLRQFEPNPRSLPVIENMERSAKRGADLIKQVLSFARGVEGSRVALRVAHILAEVESIMINTFPKNIRTETRASADLWPVLADPTQLNQVILNLCVNARDAMPEGGQLELTACNVEIDEQYAVMNRGVASGRYVLLQVTDSGCGIPKEVLDRIFEPFFTTKAFGTGTGLGLSSVQGIVHSHGGFVNVYSEVGRGSTFKVYLPAQSDDAFATVVPVDEETLPRGNGELILLVDDEVSILDITKQTLEAFGYRVVTAEDGALAIGLYAQQRDRIAAVITDMMMPVMDGPALIAALRRINPKARIIAASGLNANGNVARAASAGVKHFLSKPYSADAMIILLKQLLAEKGSQPPH